MLPHSPRSGPTPMKSLPGVLALLATMALEAVLVVPADGAHHAFLGSLAFGAGSALASKFLGGGSKGPSRDEIMNRRRANRITKGEEERGKRMGSAYEEGILAFNPLSYLESAAGGAFDQFQRDFGENMETLRGRQVGSGRLDSGFGWQDEDRLFRDMGRDLNSRIAQMSMDAGRMEMGRLGQIGGYGERARDRALDASMGRFMTERHAREQDAASQRAMWGSLGGSMLGAAGRVLGGYFGGKK